MTVSSQDTIFQHVGNGVTTIFAYGCQVPTATDMEVYLDNVLQTSGYTIQGLGASTGGTVTFAVAPANLAAIRIERVIELERTTDYQQNGDFLSGVVNPDFDRLWMALQGHNSQIKRAMMFPSSDTALPNPLPPLASRANNLLGFDANGQPVAVIPSAQSAAALQLLLASAAGSSFIGYLQAGVSAVKRTLQDWMRDTISVKDYGAIGDGTLHQLSERFGSLAAAQVVYPHATSLTNSIDWAAIQGALNYAIPAGKSVKVPAGTYIANNLQYTGAGAHSSLHGDGSACTVIKNTIDTNPVITFNTGANQLSVKGIMFSGDGTVTNWGTGNGVAGNNLVGTVPTSQAAARIINLVHADFEDCYFINAIYGADVQGGIAVTFKDCYAYWNAQVGYRIYKNGVGSGWPNVIMLRDSSAVENGQVGVYFDDGRQLIVEGGHYEGNGKNTVQAPGTACGIFIGSNTGIENGATNGPNSTPFHSMAVSITGVWLEQNGNNNGSGVPNGTQMAHVVHQHGKLVMKGCIMTNTVAGRAVRINGGQYTIENCAFESSLTVATNNVDEGVTSGNASLVAGNYINVCTVGSAGAALTAANCTIDSSKTYFDFSRYAPTKILTGSGNTSGGTLSISWPAGTWQSAPTVQAQVFTNDSGTTTYSAEVFNVTTTGATIRAKQNAGGTVTQPALLVTYIAAGS